MALPGVGSAQCPIALHRDLWARLACDLRPNGLDKIATDEVGLDGLEPGLDRVLAGGNKGRTVVRLGGG